MTVCCDDDCSELTGEMMQSRRRDSGLVWRPGLLPFAGSSYLRKVYTKVFALDVAARHRVHFRVVLRHCLNKMASTFAHTLK